MPFDDHKNFAISAVETAPSPATSGATLFVTPGHGTRFPTPPFNASIWPSDQVATPANAEIVRVTAIAFDMLAITRAQEGSTARAVLVGDQIAATITDKTLTDLETEVGAANKTMATIAVANSATETTVYSYTVPAGTLSGGFLHLRGIGSAVAASFVTVLNVRVKYGGTTFMYGAINMNPGIPNTLISELMIDAILFGVSSSSQRGAGIIAVGPPGSLANPPAAAGLTTYAIGPTGNTALAVDSAVAQPLIVTIQWQDAHVDSVAGLNAAYLTKG